MLISTPSVTASLSIASATSPLAYASDDSTIDLYGSLPLWPIFDTKAGFVVASVIASPELATNSAICEMSAVSIESTVMRASCGSADLVSGVVERATDDAESAAVVAKHATRLSARCSMVSRSRKEQEQLGIGARI